MIIEAAKGGHTQVVKLLLEYPNRVIMNGSPELEQLPEPHLNEVIHVKLCSSDFLYILAHLTQRVK